MSKRIRGTIQRTKKSHIFWFFVMPILRNLPFTHLNFSMRILSGAVEQKTNSALYTQFFLFQTIFGMSAISLNFQIDWYE